MGTFHARTIVNNLEGEAELVQIVDPDIQKAERLASELKITDTVEISEGIDDIDGDKVDGAIIASPSHTHADIARRLLGNGVNVLIEKPIALNMEDARAVDNIAKQMGLTELWMS